MPSSTQIEGLRSQSRGQELKRQWHQVKNVSVHWLAKRSPSQWVGVRNPSSQHNLLLLLNHGQLHMPNGVQKNLKTQHLYRSLGKQHMRNGVRKNSRIQHLCQSLGKRHTRNGVQKNSRTQHPYQNHGQLLMKNGVSKVLRNHQFSRQQCKEQKGLQKLLVKKRYPQQCSDLSMEYLKL